MKKSIVRNDVAISYSSDEGEDFEKYYHEDAGFEDIYDLEEEGY